MAINVSLPVSAPTNITASIQEGGGLLADTTYYYIMLAYNDDYYSPQWSSTTRWIYHSPTSSEGSFTTTADSRSVEFSWDNIPEHDSSTHYQMLLTTSSGDYTNSGGYGNITMEVLPEVTSSYLIVSESTSDRVLHSIQLVNNLVQNIDKHLGILKVDLSEAGNTTLQEIYNEITASGYDDYVYYDGFNFVLKGSFEATGTTAGSFTIKRQNLIFIKGILVNNNPNFIMTFGEWVSDDYGADYIEGCSVDIQNSRYPIGSTNDTIRFYGCQVSLSRSIVKTLTENLNTSYYYNAATGQGYFSGNITEMRDNIMGNRGRGIQTGITVQDLKWLEANNWSGGIKLRLRIMGVESTHGWNETYSKFYDCKWVNGGSGVVDNYTYTSLDPPCITRFYDCEFPYYSGSDNVIGTGSIRHVNLKVENEWSSLNNNLFHNSLYCKVIDVNGNLIESASVNMVDQYGSQSVWIELDGSYDRLISGNEYSSSVYTDNNGEMEYYTEVYQVYLNPDFSGSEQTYDSVRLEHYPFTLTVSKPSYDDYVTRVNLTQPKNKILVTLKKSKDVLTTTSGNVAVKVSDDIIHVVK